MSNITEVRPKGEKNALIILDDNSQVWTPDIEEAKALCEEVARTENNA